MTRRFEIGPILAAVGALVLLVSLFLDWYGPVSAWGAFEIADILLAALAVASLVAAAGILAPELSYVEGRWLPALAVAATVLVAAELLSPPPLVRNVDLGTGAWLALASALVLLIGAVLSIGKVSFSVAIEGRETKRRVAAVDHRQDTTESSVVTPDTDEPTSDAGEPSPPAASAVPAPSTRTASERKR
jgi:hypothetical protein